MLERHTKRFPGFETTVSIMATDMGKSLRRVIVIHRFDSGNFIKDLETVVSETAAKGLVTLYVG